MKPSAVLFLLQLVYLFDARVRGAPLQCYQCNSAYFLDCLSKDPAVLQKYQIVCPDGTTKYSGCLTDVGGLQPTFETLHRGCNPAYADSMYEQKTSDPLWNFHLYIDQQKYQYHRSCNTSLCNTQILLGPLALDRLPSYKGFLEKWQKQPKGGDNSGVPLSPPNSNDNAKGKDSDSSARDNNSRAKDAAAAAAADTIAVNAADAKAAADRTAIAGGNGDLAGAKTASDAAAKVAKDAANKLSTLIAMQAANGGTPDSDAFAKSLAQAKLDAKAAQDSAQAAATSVTAAQVSGKGATTAGSKGDSAGGESSGSAANVAEFFLLISSLLLARPR